MTKILDLPEDLVREILSKVPLKTSLSTVRSSCKKWNTLSKEQFFGKAESARMGFMVLNNRVCSIKFDFQRIRNESIDPPIKQISNFHRIEMCKIFYYDGLLLCIAKNESRVVVWNPYLGQTRWIQPTNNFPKFYGNSRNMYTLGYDNNNNLKILRVLAKNIFQPEIYCLNSSSWKVLDVMNRGYIRNNQSGVSLKGNTYFSACDRTETFLVCFDFTEERFGPRLSLPFNSWHEDFVTLSCAKEDQLAVLYQRYYEDEDEILEIWISTKIESNAISWSKFLEVDLKKFNDIPEFFQVANFFIDEEKKLVVVCECNTDERNPHAAYILGENDYFKSVFMREASSLREEFDTNWDLLGFSFYVPSLVQLQTKPKLKGKKQLY